MSLFNNDNASDNMNSGGEDASERNRQHNTEHVPASASKSVARPRAVCIGFDCIASARFADALEHVGVDSTFEADITCAIAHVVGEGLDLLIVCDSISVEQLTPVAAQIHRIAPAVKVLVAGDAPTSGRLLDALRAGVSDWIDCQSEDAEIYTRLEVAVEQCRAERRRDERVVRLKGICRKLSVTRSEFSKHIDSLAEGMSNAMLDARERVDEAAIVGEFRGLISQELDVEDLLRTSLQYLLTKTGATNAAVFLPGSKPTQFGLGAYVHYDCPRASAQPLLTALAETVCPKIAITDDIVRFADTEQFVDSLGIGATVLDDAELVAWPARHGDECMGVFFLFRNKSEPFADELAGLIDALRPVFAAQMAKLVRIHHRSNFAWPQVQDNGDESDDGESDGEEWRRAA